MRPIVASTLAALLLAACASTEGGNVYAQQYRDLERDCAARGGILLPSTGPQSSNAAADYACSLQDIDIRGRNDS